MAGRPFIPKLAPAERLHRYLEGNPHVFFLTDTFNNRTIVLLGALLQIILSAILPTRWAAVPATVLLFSSIIRTILQLRAGPNNAFAKGVTPGRTTAQLPSKTGSFGPDPASQPVVVFHLGIQFNHPLGLLAPGARDVSKNFRAMTKDLLARRDELGLLSMSDWRGKERGSNNTYLITFYFKDVASIHRFAHEELHRKAWDHIVTTKPAHIGVFHETFEVPARAYETMYVNCSPLLMGRGQALCEQKEGERWVNALVSADTPALKTQYARMGRDETGVPKAEYNAYDSL